jgi:RHS repeat-associated protein
VGGTATDFYARQGWPLDPALYYYTDTTHVHAVTRVSGLGTFEYDANGNMTRRVENGTIYTQTFDVENRLISVAVSGGGTTQYQYDASGQMVKKLAPDGTLTVYLGIVEYELTGLGGTVAHTTSYYTVPGARVVRVDNVLSYVLTDHLGSSTVTLDDGGGVDGELRYYAYGETRASSGSTPTERTYTGQLRQDDLGLDYFNARWYVPSLNRWTQPDTIVPEPGNPQALNRYAYVLGNPLKYTDPSGHVAIPALIVGGTAILALAVTFVAIDYYLVPGGHARAEAAVQGLSSSVELLSDSFQQQANTQSAVAELLILLASKAGRPLLDQEKEHIGKIDDFGDFLDTHKDLPDEAEQVLRGEELLERRDHVNEAQDWARGIEKTIDYLTNPRNTRHRSPEAQAEVEKALEKARKYQQRLRDILRDLYPGANP